MRKKISQREARRLRKRVARLEHEQGVRVARWNREYPGGVNIATITLDPVPMARLDVAQELGFTLVAKRATDGSSRLHLYAVKP